MSSNGDQNYSKLISEAEEGLGALHEDEESSGTAVSKLDEESKNEECLGLSEADESSGTVVASLHKKSKNDKIGIAWKDLPNSGGVAVSHISCDGQGANTGLRQGMVLLTLHDIDVSNQGQTATDICNMIADIEGSFTITAKKDNRHSTEVEHERESTLSLLTEIECDTGEHPPPYGVPSGGSWGTYTYFGEQTRCLCLCCLFCCLLPSAIVYFIPFDKRKAYMVNGIVYSCWGERIGNTAGGYFRIEPMPTGARVDSETRMIAVILSGCLVLFMLAVHIVSLCGSGCCDIITRNPPWNNSYGVNSC